MKLNSVAYLRIPSEIWRCWFSDMKSRRSTDLNTAVLCMEPCLVIACYWYSSPCTTYGCRLCCVQWTAAGRRGERGASAVRAVSRALSDVHAPATAPRQSTAERRVSATRHSALPAPYSAQVCTLTTCLLPTALTREVLQSTPFVCLCVRLIDSDMRLEWRSPRYTSVCFHSIFGTD